MSIATLKTKFDSLLKGLKVTPQTQFASTVESAYEALVLVKVMAEYSRLNGNVTAATPPAAGNFLNQAPGRFHINKSFKIDFANGTSFYFTADIEAFGLAALNQNIPIGTLFEIDVAVIPTAFVNDVINNFNGYPAPQHLDSVYECKFGSYKKGQLRELLGLRRHISFLQGSSITHAATNNPHKLFGFEVMNAGPNIPVKMVRPRRQIFFDIATASLYDLQEIVVS